MPSGDGLSAIDLLGSLSSLPSSSKQALLHYRQRSFKQCPSSLITDVRVPLEKSKALYFCVQNIREGGMP